MDYVDSIRELKHRLISQVGSMLSENEARVAMSDYHAKRSPRPCGLTIHPGTGCTHECIYCYIYDMGFKNEVKPYNLSGVQLVYALLSNKYFIPGSTGTYLAIGSVTEPFHPALRDKTMEYIEAIYRYLGNPTQFSTKHYVNRQTAEQLASISRGRISPLVTLVTIEYANILEPRAPRPETRLETICNLKNSGLKPFLFLRPIIPGITDREYVKILEEAKESGAVGVVAGSLRVTIEILRKLRNAGLDTREIEKRAMIAVEKMKPRVQYEIHTSDIKQAIARYARKIGLVFFPSACMANLFTHGYRCWRMCLEQIHISNCVSLEQPTREEIEAIISRLNGRLLRYSFDRGLIQLEIDCRRCDIELIKEIVRSRYRACVRVKKTFVGKRRGV